MKSATETVELKIRLPGSGAVNREIMSRASKWSLCTLLAIPLAAMLPVPFLGRMWHSVHRDFIIYHKWKIRVPTTFYVRQGTHGHFLWKLPLGFPLRHDPYAMIGVSELPHPFEYEEDYRRFTTGADLAAQDQGYKFLSTQEVSIGKTLGYCHEYGLSRDPTKSFVQCAVEHTDLLFAYRGHTRYIPILFSTLQSISAQNAPAAQSK